MTNGIMRVKGLENFTKVLIILGACGNVESMVIFWGRIKSYTIAGYELWLLDIYAPEAS